MTLHLKGREKVLEAFGWSGRKAEWIALVCLHSGVFTRRQATRFLDTHHDRARRMVHALIAQGLAAEETVPGIRGIGRVCRIYARRLYRAFGAEHIRHRRAASPHVLVRRLLSLDYVIEHLDLPWLPTEPEKVAAFGALGIERRTSCLRASTGAPRATPAATSPSSCPWPSTRIAPSSSTPNPATTPSVGSGPGERRTEGSGARSCGAATPSRPSPSDARGARRSGRGGCWAAGPRPPGAARRTRRSATNWPGSSARSTGARPEVLDEYGGLQAALKRCVALEKEARRQAGQGGIRRARTWRTTRLAGVLYR